MTTPITKEWLQQTISEYEASRDEIPFGLETNSAMELEALKIALAAMDSEPVAYADPQALRNFLDGAARREWMWRNPAPDLIPLYAAPPALAVSDQKLMYNPLSTNAVDAVAAIAEVIGWNTRRAAMLQADNSPAIPDGWVACSERMPDCDYVLAADFSGKQYPANMPNIQIGIYADWWGDGSPCWDDGDGNYLHLKQVTHWMPLPAAPQQEVNP